MSNETAISLQGIGKTYRVWQSPEARLQAALWSLLRQERRAQGYYQDFVALADVNLEIKRGESLGIVGLNGSGKSTLLQIIAGTLHPSAGEVAVRGRIAALLELGAGFNPDFTGRENVYLNAAVLGLSRAEVDQRFAAIAEFADIGDFIEQPVKTYSSGMYIRLAFAVLSQIDPDILIIDEALAVGDFLFQQKCYDKIREFRKRGCTFLFVSHGMGTVLELCDRAIVLDRGRMIFAGDPKSAVDLYESHSLRTRFGLTPAPAAPPPPASDDAAAPSPEAPPAEAAITTDAVSLEHVSVQNSSGQIREIVMSGDEITIVISFRARRALHDPHIGFKIRDRLGVVFYETNTYCMRQTIGPVQVGDLMTARFRARVPLIEGEYSITAAIANGGRDRHSFDEALHYQHDSVRFAITRNWSIHEWHGIVNITPQVTIGVER